MAEICKDVTAVDGFGGYDNPLFTFEKRVCFLRYRIPLSIYRIFTETVR